MKIAQIVAGAGAMYCGACARDASLARTLAGHGVDLTIWPIYTPVRVEGKLDVPQAPLAFGGIAAYLREVAPWLERLPKWTRTWMDSQGLLNFASRFAVQTQAADLGAMTVSVLQGLEGRHSAAIRELAAAVADDGADVAILPNTMLASLGPALREAGVRAVLCQVQGEDGFLAELPEPWRSKARSLIQRHVMEVDRMIAPCADHADAMGELLDLAPDRFAVVPPTVLAPPFPFPPKPPGERHIGCLSSIRRAKGQDLLLAARSVLPFEADLSFAGRTLEPRFLKQLRQMSVSARPTRFLGEIAPNHKAHYFESCDVVCLPSRLRESRSFAGLEALVSGRPIVAPGSGIFLELADLTQAVHLFRPEDPHDLARAIEEALATPCGDSAKVVAEAYGSERAAEAFDKVIRTL